MKSTVATIFTLGAALGLGATSANAGGERGHRPGAMPFETPEFGMVGTPVATSATPQSAKQRPWLSGSTIAAVGSGALAIDADSGMLALTDAQGNPVSKLRIGFAAGQLVYHPGQKRAYVADRLGDRIIIVDVSSRLKAAGVIATPTEPFGMAMSPSGKTLIVTAVADRRLVGYDTSTRKQRWIARLGPEPRGIAVSPTGRQAIVTMLTSGAVAKVNFKAGKPPMVSYVSITPRDAAGSQGTGKAFARNAFAATYVGNGVAVIPHQLSRPVAAQEFDRGTYGGGGREPQVQHRLAFLEATPGGIGTSLSSARADIHQPRAIAYDARRDRMYVAGLGSDEVLAVENASQNSVKGVWQRTLGDGGEFCGPNGLAVGQGGHVFVFCSFSHRVVRLAPDAHEAHARSAQPTFAVGPALGRGRLSAAAQRGREIFHRGEDSRLSGQGALACASCHSEGRADGLSWQISGTTLQTPMLAGRIRGTHPYKWDGKDPDIMSSLRNTVGRLGGSGLSSSQAADLRAYIDSLPRPRAPRPKDAIAVARGKKLFDGTAGCRDCHSGPRLTDRKRYALAKDLDKVDTPSLIGLANSAPYYHDGSAQTLKAALMDNGTIHDMGVTIGLTGPQLDDLVTYLKTL